MSVPPNPQQLPSAVLGTGAGNGGAIYPSDINNKGRQSIVDRTANSNVKTVRLIDSRNKSAQVAEDPAPRTGANNNGYEFESIVEQTVGQPVKLFGYDAFTDGSFGLSASDIAAPIDYVMGPGDEVSIRSWGQVDIDVTATINNEGTIFLPRVGTITLSGKKAGSLERTLRGAISRYFRNYKLAASLTNLRSVAVYVTGKGKQPGLHRIPALSTLIHAVFSVGAPTRQGDLRRVQLKRDGKLVATIDLYEFLVNGNKSGDVPVLTGDVIHIPTIKGQAALVGSVRTPAIFQLRDDTTLGALIEYAGGLTTSGSTQRIVIERTNQNESREVIELGPDDSGLDQLVSDGDLINILPKSPRIENSVTLKGNVALPIRGAWRLGMRISDLIPDARALMFPAYWMNRNRATGQGMLYEGTHRSTAKPNIQQINWDYAVLERLDPTTLIPKLIPFNLAKVVKSRDPEHDHLLEPGDTITVFALNDFKVNQAKRTRYVRVEGEVGRSGLYQLEVGETLPQLIARIGGFTDLAYLYGIELRRESVRAFQQMRMDETIQKLEHEAYRLVSLNSRSAISEEQSEALPVQLEALRSLIDRLKQVKATGRVVLETPKSGTTLAALPEYVLQDGDTIMVPSKPSVVSIVGAVYQEGPILHRTDRTVGEYMALAGGPTANAYDEPPIILRADGSIVVEGAGNDWGMFRTVTNMSLMPGDTIVMRENLDQVNWGKIIKDWTQVIYQFGIGAASLLILRGI